MNWISVKDERPATGAYVLMIVDKVIYTGSYVKNWEYQDPSEPNPHRIFQIDPKEIIPKECFRLPDTCCGDGDIVYPTHWILKKDVPVPAASNE